MKNGLKLTALAVSIFTALVFTTSSLSPVLAAATNVRVFAFKSDGNPSNGATVNITCNGVTQAAANPAFNEYTTTFADGVCEQYDTVSATIQGTNGETGSGNAQVFNGLAVLNITTGPNVVIPEFGLMTGAAAALGSAAVYLKLRKRAAV